MTRIALIDGPLPPGQFGCTTLLDPENTAVVDSSAGHHASALAAAIHSAAPDAEILSIPVFKGGLSARVSDLVTALRIAADIGAEITHCSLGLGRNDPDVAAAIAALQGRIIVASAPARGDPVWPAALPAVLSVQGDARCGPGQWSVLDLPTADYGACPHPDPTHGIAGASLAAARLTGLLAGQALTTETEARHWLRSAAAWYGRERRTADQP
ncbi:subtilisin-like serine protease QhpE [Tropicibacter sp. S64]|uniref:subtilisin-like serine protease QhpE n=1 Tax=Tropicibacter sp. S64 TaxID=3415122 RepID=UPI003C7EAE8C